jgi:AcrR family transcriptional regulator
MARRSDYTREELKEMAISAGQKIIAEEGFAEFSARKAAKSIGYTIGTIYNIFASHDDFILHINAVTLADMAEFMENKASSSGEKAVKQLAEAYIEFAQIDYNRWSALFEHQLPKGEEPPAWYQQKIKKLFDIVERHFEEIISDKKQAEIAAKTIWAGIHGICQLSLTGKLDTVGVSSMQELTDSLIDNYLKGMKA